MARGSTLPPLKNNEGKYGIVAVLLLLGAGGAWYYFGQHEPGPEPPPPPPAPAPRGQFAPEIELPDQDAGVDAAVAEPSRPRVRRERCTGTLALTEIRKVINGPARAQVRSCYERRLKDNNLLQGSMNLMVTIGTSGKVTHASVSGSLDDQRVFSCVKKVARTWKFPQPVGGCVRASVPFMMTPKQ